MRAQERLPRGRPLRHGRQTLRLQDPRDRRTTDAMPDVLQGPWDPRIAPRRIFLRHPHNQAPDLGEHPATTQPRRRPLARDQPPVPSAQRIGRHNGGDLAQCPTAHPKGPHRELPSIIIGEAQTPPAQLPGAGGGSPRSGTRAPPALGARASRSGPSTAGEGRGGNHEPEVISRLPCSPSTTVGRAVGQYGLR